MAYAHTTVLSGVASWYGPGFHGRTTANGEKYNMNGMTAAHKSLKFGTKVRVTNENNGKSVVVRINDRGPYVGSRIIDLSKSAAQAIDMIGPGTAAVTVEVLA
ncbi:septal ring lytic transglycosylase RlpA family protein [Devosia naphthalenivorans]|uniref:septal ring lytic transglycosylase RlpA family protein n=1 Tax=Devosia naphthalenivorans TaxID=2082392 RepID=UPI001FE74643|nr:septal ring lytic transglycosylase RlpA family protein [Devosia naphthalenivorans]